jgi:hypothetical protein
MPRVESPRYKGRDKAALPVCIWAEDIESYMTSSTDPIATEENDEDDTTDGSNTVSTAEKRDVTKGYVGIRFLA